jgi:ribose transport system ATP-binding protein
VVCIFQELSLMPDLSVAENVTISTPPRRFGLIDSHAQRRRAEALLAEIGCEDVNPLSRVRDLALSRRQMVEIAKALGHKPRLLILDEATSALTAADVEKVYRLLAQLKAQGVAILYISHRMHEVDALADRASVFRNGRHIETFDKGARSTPEIVQLMIGRDIATQYPPKPAPKPRPPALRVERLNWENKLADISLDVGAGEIVGLGGLDGQGQKMLLLALFGVLKGVGGRIEVNGKTVRLRSPGQAKSRDIGVALVPEDRKTEGLMLAMSIGDNLTLASLGSLASGPFIDGAKERQAIRQGVERLRIKFGAVEDPVSSLSGGNQQKVVVAKWLMTEPRVVLFNDPTRGIDVGAKQEIYRLMRELADQGAAILFYSTDYDELIGCCDRVAIMYDGRIVRELKGAEITETNIVASSLNVEEAAHV